MKMGHSREPIKHTCPAIDGYIRLIRKEIIPDSYLNKLTNEEVFDCASSMSSMLEDCIGYLEELRESNDVLRAWGIEEAKEVDGLKNEIEEMKCLLQGVERWKSLMQIGTKGLQRKLEKTLEIMVNDLARGDTKKIVIGLDMKKMESIT